MPIWNQIIFTYVYVLIPQRELRQQNPLGAQLICLNVLSLEGSCECRSRMGSNWFLLCFNYSELCSRNVLGCFKMRLIIRLLKILKMLYCDGWMDGLVGGDFLPPWIFFIFKYNKKQNELLPKLCVKIAFAY